MKLTLFTFQVIFGRFLQKMFILTTNSFANISAQVYPMLALFVLNDRTTRQLTNKSVTASSGTHFFHIIFLKCDYFPEIDTENA